MVNTVGYFGSRLQYIILLYVHYEHVMPSFAANFRKKDLRNGCMGAPLECHLNHRRVDTYSFHDISLSFAKESFSSSKVRVAESCSVRSLKA